MTIELDSTTIIFESIQKGQAKYDDLISDFKSLQYIFHNFFYRVHNEKNLCNLSLLLLVITSIYYHLSNLIINLWSCYYSYCDYLIKHID